MKLSDLPDILGNDNDTFVNTPKANNEDLSAFESVKGAQRAGV